MKLASVALAALVGIATTGMPCLAHTVAHGSSSLAHTTTGHGHPPAVAVFCGSEFDEYGGFSFFYNNHGFEWTGGIDEQVEVGAQQVGVGFRIDIANCNSYGFKSTTSGNGDPFTFYVYSVGNSFFEDDLGIDTKTSNGVTKWRFLRSNTNLPKNARIRNIYFLDFGNGGFESFTDVAANITVDNVPIVPLSGLQADCGGT